MDYFDVLISVNKISIFFFAITIVFIIYEFYLFQKDRWKTKDVPVKLPEIDGKSKVVIKNSLTEAFSEPVKHQGRRPSKVLLVFGGLLVVLFGLLFVISYTFLAKKDEPQTTVTRAAAPTLIPSPTIALPSPTVAQPTSVPSPTTTLLADVGDTEEEELVEEIIAEEEEPTETPTPTEVEELPVAGTLNYSLIIFASSIVLFFVAFIL